MSLIRKQLSNEVREMVNKTPYRVRISKHEVARHFKCSLQALNHVFNSMVNVGGLHIVAEGKTHFGYYKIAEIELIKTGTAKGLKPSKTKVIKQCVQKRPIGERFYKEDMCKEAKCVRSTSSQAFLQMVENKEIKRVRDKERREFIYWRIKDIDVDYDDRQREIKKLSDRCKPIQFWNPPPMREDIDYYGSRAFIYPSLVVTDNRL